MKSITKTIALVLALLMVAGLAACGGETNTKAPQNAGPTANTAVENAAQPEPEKEPEKEPEPAPRPFAIGTHSESKYRNEYLGMEIALGEPGLTDIYFKRLGAYGISTDYWEPFTADSTTESAKAAIDKGKAFLELELYKKLEQENGSANVSVFFTKNSLNGENLANDEYQDRKFSLENKTSTELKDLYDKFKAVLGDREWSGFDMLIVFEGYNTYTRQLYFGDQGIATEMDIELTFNSGKGEVPSYEAVKPVLDEITASFVKIDPSSQMESGPLHKTEEISFAETDFSPLSAYGISVVSADADISQMVDAKGVRYEGTLTVRMEIKGGGNTEIWPSSTRNPSVNGIELPKPDGTGTITKGENQVVMITLDLKGTALEGAKAEEITEIRLPLIVRVTSGSAVKNNEADFCVLKTGK